VGDVLLPLVGLGLVLVAVWLLTGPLRRTLRRLIFGTVGRYQEARRAEQRAEMLLRDILTPPEYARLLARGFLDVRSPSRPNRTYRIPRDGGIVVLREAGRTVGGLCVQATQPVPAADAVAMHKLMIEGAESEYLQRANHLSVGALYRYGLGVLYER
jgi:hypothetical protein